jgi:PAS domain S-box-containing protein
MPERQPPKKKPAARMPKARAAKRNPGNPKRSGHSQSNDQLRTIIDTIPTLVWSTRVDGSPEFFNRRWLDYTGLSAGEAVAGKWVESIHPNDRNVLLTRWRASLSTGEPFEIEVRQRRFDGEYRWFLVRGSALRDSTGRIAQWYGANTDIEDWHQAKESVRVSERHLQLVLDSLPGLSYTQTPDGGIELASRRVHEYFGTSSNDEHRDWAARGLVHPDDLERAFREIAAGISAGAPYTVVLRQRRFDGVFRWFQCQHTPLRDSDGTITRWYGYGADIDDIERAASASRASEQGWRLIVDGLPGLIYTMTPTCELEFVNRKVLEYFGRSFEELRDWDRIGAVHPDDLSHVKASLRRTVEHEEPHEVEQRLRRADGVYRWFKPRGSPERDAEGHIVRWFCLLTDIDELKKAEELLRGNQARLARAAHLATVSELSASIAHEINQPLGALVTNAQACKQWLSNEPPNVERALRSAELIVRDGTSAAEVVRRIRSLFKRAPLVKHALNSDEVIDEVCSLMNDDLRDHQVVLEKRLEGGGVQIVADRVQIQQLLVNLIRNAIEAMDTVTNRVRRIAIVSRSDDNELVVLVTDDGVGIQDSTAVFESFYSTKAHGLGMGLAICRSIVEAHDGRLWATRNVPHGSTFGFALPIHRSESPPILAAPLVGATSA